MPLASDESRAVAVVALLLLLATVARVRSRPADVEVDGAVAVAALRSATAAAVASEERRAKPLGPGDRIDPNTAPAEELDRLPGIGRSLAERIIAARESAGGFRHLGDLVRVAGIGERTIERLSPHLSIAGTGRGPGAPPRHPKSVLAGDDRVDGIVDVNRADAAEMERLPGIGPALARRIVAYRDSMGPFATPEELTAVAGIGAAKLERMRPHLRLEP